MKTSSNVVGLCFLAYVLGVPDAFSQSLPAPVLPQTSATGNYTVHYGYGGGSCGLMHLQESQAGGSWQTVDSDLDGVFVATDRASGIHSYRLYALCEPLGGDGGSPFISASSTIQVVRGTLPVRPTLDEQLEFRYEARTGDLNADGRTDIYVKRVYGGEPLDGSIDEIFLLRSSDADFSFKVPNVSEKALGELWPLSPNVTFNITDLNFDGSLDLALGLLGQASPGSRDQVILSPGVLLSATPKGVFPVTDALVETSEDIYSVLTDTTFLSSRLVVVTEVTYEPTVTCGWEFIDGHLFFDCYETIEVVETNRITYPGVDPAAIEVDALVTSILGGTSSVSELQALLTNALGWVIDRDGVQFCPADQALECYITIVLGSLGTVIDEKDRDKNQNQVFGMIPGRIYVLYRDLFVISDPLDARHLSLYYRPGPAVGESIPGINIASIGTWFSAFPEDPSEVLENLQGKQYMESHVDIGLEAGDIDHPSLMRPAGVVVPEASSSFGNTLDAIAQAGALLYVPQFFDFEANFDDQCLRYKTIPDPDSPETETMGEGGYNSGSYVSGMVGALNPDASVDWYQNFDWDNFLGAEKPVPDRYFTESSLDKNTYCFDLSTVN